MVRGLGRGFDSLIPTELIDEEFDPTADVDEKISKLQELNLKDVIRDEGQPRRSFSDEAIGALAQSIREHGVLQPIVVVREGKQYKIVAGERRWRAAKVAELAKIPAIVRTLSDQNRLELSLIENVQREDLNAIETATAYAKLRDQFNMDTKAIGKRIGKSEAAVINTMRLLNLPEEAKRAMVENKLTEGQMRPLVSVSPDVVSKVLPKIIEEEWSARRVEQYVAGAKKKSAERVIRESEFTEEEQKLSKKLGASVTIRNKEIVIKCKNAGKRKQIIEKLGR
jgi:ParB family chromosome partitioning protein